MPSRFFFAAWFIANFDCKLSLENICVQSSAAIFDIKKLVCSGEFVIWCISWCATVRKPRVKVVTIPVFGNDFNYFAAHVLVGRVLGDLHTVSGKDKRRKVLWAKKGAVIIWLNVTRT